ncbi:MAG TPA: hypothetical protein VMV28_03890, partial [Thermoplasmata archaeon]|nr:hypothetical protein [Thermoplasmata archaeon]
MAPDRTPRLEPFLAEGEDRRRWHRNVAQGSRATADVYARRLAAFCRAMKTSPEALAKLGDKALRDVVLDFVEAESKAKHAGSYIHSTVKAVNSWRKHAGRPSVRGVNVRGRDSTPTLVDEVAPTPEQVRAVLARAPVRNRVICALMAYSGVRPEVVGDYLGEDGLTLGDLPELELTGDRPRFKKTPALVIVREGISKARHTYVTFAPSVTCRAIEDYLRYRLARGEKLTRATDLVSPGRGANRFLRAINVGDGVRAAFRALGMQDRPYVLRVYFETRLGVAEGQAKVVHRFVVHWGGHKGDITARYSLNKNRLPGDLIEEMREAFRRCEPTLTGDAPSEGDVRREVSRTLLGALGYSDKELEAVDLANLAQVRELTLKRVSPPAKKQALVSVEELPGYLDAGWTFVGNVGQDRVLLSPPAGAGGPTSPPSPPG